VSFAAITVYVASQRVFIVISVYFFIDSVRKLLDTPEYITVNRNNQDSLQDAYIGSSSLITKTLIRVK
jgi:hypothetical protein